MGRITLALAAQWCGGQIDEKYADVSFLGASGDHRWVKPGELFVTLDQGPNLNESIRVAMERGAAAILSGVCIKDHPCIVVSDPRRALGDIARKERNRIGMQVVGVTGSVGKTTVTEMIACVLEGTYRVGKTLSNQFEDIGMPMAILAMPEDTQVAVLEMGMNHFREIAYLTSVARPDLAVITNIGGAPGESSLSPEEILRAKLEILEGMREESKVILNGDDPLLWKQRDKPPVATVFYGTQNAECDFLAENITRNGGVTGFTIRTKDQRFPMELSPEGECFALDAMAAVCVGLQMGVAPALIQERLSAFRNTQDVTREEKLGDLNLILSCWNAGPVSMANALEDLGKRSGRRIAVLGDILELKICTQAEHYRIGRLAAENADIMLAYGPNARRLLSGAITGGMSPNKAMAFTEEEKLLSTLEALVRPADTVLFKGCRSTQMQKLADSFIKRRKEI